MSKKNDRSYDLRFIRPPRLNFDPSWDIMICPVCPQISRSPTAKFKIFKGDKECTAFAVEFSNAEPEWYVSEKTEKEEGYANGWIPFKDGEKLIDFIKSIVDGD